MKKNNKGSALLIVILSIVIIATLIAVSLNTTNHEARMTEFSSIETKANYINEALLEYGLAQCEQYMATHSVFTPDIFTTQTNPADNFLKPPNKAEFETQSLKILDWQITAGVVYSRTQHIDASDPATVGHPYRGENLTTNDVMLIAKTTVKGKLGHEITVHGSQIFTTLSVPLLSNAVFYHNDLNWIWRGQESIYGPTTVNGNLMLGSHSSFDFYDTVTVGGELVWFNAANGEAKFPGSAWDQSVNSVPPSSQMVSLKEGTTYYDSNYGASLPGKENIPAGVANDKTDGYYGNDSEGVAVSWTEFSNARWQHVKTSDHGTTPRLPAAFESIFDEDYTNENQLHKLIEPPTDAVALEAIISSAAATDEEIEEAKGLYQIEMVKFANKSGLVIDVAVNPTDLLYGKRDPSNGTNAQTGEYYGKDGERRRNYASNVTAGNQDPLEAFDFHRSASPLKGNVTKGGVTTAVDTYMSAQEVEAMRRYELNRIQDDNAMTISVKKYQPYTGSLGKKVVRKNPTSGSSQNLELANAGLSATAISKIFQTREYYYTGNDSDGNEFVIATKNRPTSITDLTASITVTDPADATATVSVIPLGEDTDGNSIPDTITNRPLKMWDARRGRWMHMAELNVGNLKAALEGGTYDDGTAVSASDKTILTDTWNGGVYVNFTHLDPTSADYEDIDARGNNDGIKDMNELLDRYIASGLRLTNAEELPSYTAGGAEEGLTLSTNNSVYLQGNWNADGNNLTATSTANLADDVNEVPSAIAADAFNLLSNKWLDYRSRNIVRSRYYQYSTDTNQDVMHNKRTPSSNRNFDDYGIAGNKVPNYQFFTDSSVLNNYADTVNAFFSGKSVRLIAYDGYTKADDYMRGHEISAAIISGIAPNDYLNSMSSAEAWSGIEDMALYEDLVRYLEHWSYRDTNVNLRGSWVNLWNSETAPENYTMRYQSSDPKSTIAFHEYFSQNNPRYPPLIPDYNIYGRVKFNRIDASQYTQIKTVLNQTTLTSAEFYDQINQILSPAIAATP